MSRLSFPSRSAVLAPRILGEGPGIPYEVLQDTAAISTLSRAAVDAHDDYRNWRFANRAGTLVNDTGFPYASANRMTSQEGFLAAQPDMSDNTTRIAKTFVEARRDGNPVPEFPGDVPVTLDQGYAVQDAALRLADGVVAGWKVGRINPPLDGVNRLTGPIFAAQVVTASADPVAMPVFAQGFAAAEAEFLLRIGTAPDPAKSAYTIDEASAMIDAVHVGIEIASSPFPGINALGPTVTVSDFGNNNGLVVGADADGWRAGDINDWPVELRINDALIGAATGATMLDGPFGAVRYLLEHLASRGIAVSPGQWISTGAITGVHPVEVGDRVEACFDKRFTVHCTIKAR